MQTNKRDTFAASVRSSESTLFIIIIIIIIIIICAGGCVEYANQATNQQKYHTNGFAHTLGQVGPAIIDKVDVGGLAARLVVGEIPQPLLLPSGLGADGLEPGGVDRDVASHIHGRWRPLKHVQHLGKQDNNNNLCVHACVRVCVCACEIETLHFPAMCGTT